MAADSKAIPLTSDVSKDAENASAINQEKSDIKVWKCKKCGACFAKTKLLKEHRKVHQDYYMSTKHTYKYDQSQDLYNCNTCAAEYNKEEEIKKHVETHEESFQCDKCKKKFQRLYKYAIHLYEHSEDKIFRCPLCSFNTNRRTGLLQHVNYTHLQKFRYHCNLCGRGFNDCAKYRDHNNEHLGIKPFVCIVCNKGFVYSRYLFTHQVRYHRPYVEGNVGSNQCDYCHRYFASNSNLTKHISLRHMKVAEPLEKKYLCDICGKAFARKEKMIIHHRVHTGIKPYECSYCGKSFTKKDYMIMHERVHSGEKPYVCVYCGKCFNQGAPLRIHIRSHTGERPYVCHICQSRFISKGALNQHFKTCKGS